MWKAGANLISALKPLKYNAMTKKPEDSAKERENSKVIELKAKLEKELAALLAHPSVPEEFKKVFEERK